MKIFLSALFLDNVGNNLAVGNNLTNFCLFDNVDFRKSKLSRHLLSQSTETCHFMAPKMKNLKMESDLLLKPQNRHFMTKNLKKNANLEKMLKMRKTYALQILQRTTKNLMKTDDTENLMRIMARHLECHTG